MEKTDQERLLLALGRIADALLKIHTEVRHLGGRVEAGHGNLMGQAHANNALAMRILDKIDEARKDIDDAADDVEKLRDDLTPIRGTALPQPQPSEISVGPVKMNESLAKKIAPIAGHLIIGAAIAIVIAALIAAYVLSHPK